MKSKANIELQANGTLLDITQGEDKLFQGAVAVNEFYLTVADGVTGDYNWRQTDVVYLSFKRPDGKTGQVKMTPDGTGWVYTSNGWETDVDISGSDILEVSFLVKRYSTVSVGTVVLDKTTEKLNLTIYASAGYVPQNLDLDTAEVLEEQINDLQLYKVGRYSVSAENLPYLPADITYDEDGAKTPNNLYYDFTHDVIDNEATVSRTGAIFVFEQDGTQHEWFLTTAQKQYSRTIVGATVGDFTNLTETEIKEYAYSKDQADARFVNIDGDEIINDTKTFTDSPVIPNATANTHAINKDDLQTYSYSKDEVNNITQAILFDTEANFLDWINGTYTRPDGFTPADMIVGKQVLIKEPDKNNWICISTPVTSLSNFEAKAEDVKYLSEINSTPFDDITATNGQASLEQVNDKVNLKTQVAELDDLTILTTDWVEDSGNVYYDYFNVLYVNPLEQSFEFQNTSLTQSDLIELDGFEIKNPLENITSGNNYGIRIYANKVAGLDLTFKVILTTYTDTAIPADILSASKITYDNSTSGLTATEVQSAIDEVNTKADGKINKTLSKVTSTPQYAVMLQTNGDPKYTEAVSEGIADSPPNDNPKVAMYDSNGELGSTTAPSTGFKYPNKNYVDNATAVTDNDSGDNANVNFDVGSNNYSKTVNNVANATNSTNASNIIVGSDAEGDLYYRNATGTTRLPIGSENELLKVNASGVPEWEAEYETLYDGTALGTVDLSAFTFTAGDELKVYYKTSLANSETVKTVEIGADATYYLEEKGDNYWQETLISGSVGGTLTGLQVVSADRNLVMLTADKILKFGSSSIKSRTFDLVTNDYLTENTTAYFLITKVLRKV